MVEVSIKDFVEGKCPIMNCEYNCGQGTCENDSEEHLADMMNSILEDGEILDRDVVCSGANIDESRCEECGGNIVEKSETEEFWGAMVSRPVWSCEDCGA